MSWASFTRLSRAPSQTPEANVPPGKVTGPFNRSGTSAAPKVSTQVSPRSAEEALLPVEAEGLRKDGLGGAVVELHRDALASGVHPHDAERRRLVVKVAGLVVAFQPVAHQIALQVGVELEVGEEEMLDGASNAFFPHVPRPVGFDPEFLLVELRDRRRGGVHPERILPGRLQAAKPAARIVGARRPLRFRNGGKKPGLKLRIPLPVIPLPFDALAVFPRVGHQELGSHLDEDVNPTLQQGPGLRVNHGCQSLVVALLSRRASSSTGGKVVSLGAFKAKQKSRTEGSGVGRERRGLRPVYSSVFRSDVESLLEVLRAEGMNPMMVTQNRGGAKNLPFYMVMLQEKDAAQAKPIIDLYAIPSAKKPS
jgi:hypothetical protein